MIDLAFEEMPSEYRHELATVVNCSSFRMLIAKADAKIVEAMQDLDYATPEALHEQYRILRLKRELLQEFQEVIAKTQPPQHTGD